ncbi:hypothetical protein [Paraburkholderia sp. SIMBA_054]|uniref:hypothetical protein n=1 Tax=Paraburkholderia sp. SIMBA_054 TaxID=3085795 RepID=UPI00397BBC29
MATYDRFKAAERAVEIAKLAVQAGLINSVTPHGLDDPAKSGTKAAEWVGGFIAELTDRIEKL